MDANRSGSAAMSGGLARYWSTGRRADRCTGVALAVLGAASVLGVQVGLPPGAARASGPAGRAVEVRAPANAAADPAAGLSGVSCTSATSCVAGGGYHDTSRVNQAMLATESGGIWARARELAMPSDAASDPFANIISVACTGRGSCVAVGHYDLSPVSEDGFIVTERKGKWGRAFKPRLPLNAAGIPNAALFGVSCRGTGSCVAVGSYQTRAGQTEGMAATESGGRWRRGTEIKAPAGAAANPGVNLMSVGCAAAGFCAAVGFFTGRAGHLRGMAVSESNGRWAGAVVTAVPANASKTVATLSSVACTARGSCVAAGSYIDRSNHLQAMILTESGHHWRKAVRIAMPANAGPDPVAVLNSVACRRTGHCLAVGSYISRARQELSIRATESGGRWRRAVQVSPPANHRSGATEASLLGGVACPASRSCVAVGGYLDQAGHLQAMAAALPAP